VIDMMNGFDPDKMKNELEKNTNNFRFTRGDILNKITNKYLEQKRKDEAKNFSAEAAAFLLIVDGDSFPGYFQPIAVFANEKTFPSYDFFSADVLKYFKERAKTTKNPIIASRFADVVWDFCKDIEMARIAIDSYIEAVKIFKKNLWGIEYARDLTRAAHLASMINDPKYIERTKAFSLTQMNELDEEKDYRFCIDIAHAISSSKIQLNSSEQETVKNILNRGMEYYKKSHKKEDSKLGPTEGPNEHLYRSLNDSLIALIKTKKVNDLDVKKVMMKIAESHESQGDEAFDGGNPLAALFFYLRAEKKYGELGHIDERDHVRVKLRKAGLLSEEEMKKISVEVPVDKEQLEAFIAPLIKIDIGATLELISRSPQFVPSTKDAVKRVEELKKDYPLQYLIPRVHLDQGHVIDQSFSLDKLEKQSFIDQLILDISVGNYFLDYLFTKLENSGKLKTSDFLKHFKKWGYCKDKNLVFLEHGLNHYFAQNYVSALHILIFQFEDMLRNLLEAADEPISEPGQIYILKSLLDNDVFKIAAGDDLQRYYAIVLREQNGLNYRNKIAHGLMNPTDMNKSVTIRVIHVLLSLTRFQIKK
jgi:hypothetical protein